MKDKITQAIITIAIAYVYWISSTVYEQSKTITLMEYRLETLYPVLQELSEK